MTHCEMCGVDVDNPTEIRVEGAVLETCENCSSVGTPLDQPESNESDEPSHDEPTEVTSSIGTSLPSSLSATDETTAPLQVEELAYDYDTRIKNARERIGHTTAELANRIDEEESFIQNLESGKSIPTDEVRRKLERELNVLLTEPGGQ